MSKPPRYHSLLGFVPGSDDEAAARLADALPEDPLAVRAVRRICPECDGLDGYHSEGCPKRVHLPAPQSNGKHEPKRTLPEPRKLVSRLLRELADRIERG